MAKFAFLGLGKMGSGMAGAEKTGMSVGETAYEWYRMALDSLADQDNSAMLNIATSHNGHISKS